MKKLFVCLAINTGVLGGGTALADCVTPKLVKITTADVSPEIPADSFARKPKVMYRLGNGKVRLEEQPDPAQNLHLLIISDAPNSWQIDLVSKSGQWVVDEAVSKTVHAPLFMGEGVPEVIMALEYGCEHQFIAHPDTRHERKETSQGVALKHFVESGRYKATLVMREGSDQLFAAMLSQDGKVVSAVRYLGYETFDAIPEGLFAPPSGVEIQKIPGSPSPKD